MTQTVLAALRSARVQAGIHGFMGSLRRRRWLHIVAGEALFIRPKNKIRPVGEFNENPRCLVQGREPDLSGTGEAD